MEWVGSTITAIINAGTRIYIAAFFASSAVLFLPSSLISQLGLEGFRDSNRTYAGITLIVSASLLLTSIVSAILDLLNQPFREWRTRKRLINVLSETTSDEKVFLAPFINNGDNTRYAEIYDGVAKGLEAKGIIYRSSSVSDPGGRFPYNMQPVARKILLSKKKLLDV